jgi:serine/threonine-protein kinase HipA
VADIKKLDVYRGADLVGQLLDESELQFVYAQSWLDSQGKSIAPKLHFSEQKLSGLPVESYFENLLPEAGIRELLKLKYQVSSTFGLLSVIGGDTASDLMILPEGQRPNRPEYQKINWDEVALSFKSSSGPIQIAQQEKGMRISLAGAQRKLGILMHEQGNISLPLGSAPSSYIVKPDIAGIEGIWASAMNETFVMKLAYQLGLDAAPVLYQPTAKSCIIKRYDRIANKAEDIQKIHQMDLCQLDLKPSTVKYEADGGPSLLRCYELLKESGVPASDFKRFLQWIFFNLFVGNNDSHAKNLSVYFPPGLGARLTPFYDLLSTSIYPGLSNQFAFKIGGENRTSHIGKAELCLMANELGFKEQYVLKIGQELSENLQAQIGAISVEMNSVASVGAEKTMVERLSQHISSNTSQLQKRFFSRSPS